MATQLFPNNFRTTLAATFGAGDTLLQLTSAAGLPELTGDQFYLLTIFRLDGVVESGHEVLKVTARTALQCTVERSVEGADASEFLAGAIIAARITGASLEAKADKATVEAALTGKADAASTSTALASLTTTVNSKADDAATTAALSQKAPLDSPTFTGSPRVPTAAPGTNSTVGASTAFVQAAIDALVNASPAQLDTLNELATALNNDPNFASTMTAALAGKQPLDATLTALAGLSVVADRMIYATGVDTFGVAPLTTFARTLLDDGDAATMRSTLAVPQRAGFPVGLGTIAASDLRTLANPTTGLGYAGGMRVRFAYANDVSGAYADVIDLSTYNDASGGGFNSLYFNKSAQQIKHKHAAADATAWTEKTLAYLESPAFSGIPAVPTAAAGTNTTQAASTAFARALAKGFLSKSVAGGVDVNLTEDECANGILHFSGALTANINVIVPQTANQWVIYNATSGAYTLTVKTSVSPGVLVKQNNTKQLFCNGSQIISSRTDFDGIAIANASSVTADSMTAKAMMVGSPTAVGGGNGQVKFYRDTGVLGWALGVDGSAGGTSMILYDMVGGASRLGISPDGTMTWYVAGNQRAQVNAGGVTVTGAVNQARATVASAATTADIWGALGNDINWTGSATCTGFPAAPQAGAERTLICAASAPFTAGANMLIDGVPSGATITLPANTKVIVKAITTTQFNLIIIPVAGIGYKNIPQNSQSANYTCGMVDAGGHLLHPSADTTARIFTIPANASVPYAVGTAITFVNQNGGGVITISITTDTMRLAGAGTTGNRTLAANGVATALKITATEWIISGVGLS